MGMMMHKDSEKEMSRCSTSKVLLEQFQSQKKIFSVSGASDYQTRKTHLENLLQAIHTYTDSFGKAVSKDFGHRSTDETRLLEIIPIIQSIRYSLKRLSDWMEPSQRLLPLWFRPSKARVFPQALGVVGIVAAWNYPLQLSLLPLVAALSAGNRVMLKLSVLTPATNALLEKMLSGIFLAQEVQVVTGGEAVFQEFIALPFDHLFFTGSVEVGKKVYRTASQHLVPVTLELGGKSPVIIASQFPMQMAVDRILTGKLLNAGQTCVAPDYLFLPKFSQSLFVEQAKRFVAKHYAHLKHNLDYTAIIDHAHFHRLKELLKDARKKGAEIIPLAEVTIDEDKRKFIPTLVFHTDSTMRLMQEEIFGPILPVLLYENIQEVIGYINDRPKPLALYLFDNNFQRITEVIKRTVSGGVTVNGTLWHAAVETLPFGGVGASGIGKYHGKAGFDTFTHYKSIFIQSDFSLLSWIRPPFKKWVERLNRFLQL